MKRSLILKKLKDFIFIVFIFLFCSFGIKTFAMHESVIEEYEKNIVDVSLIPQRETNNMICFEGGNKDNGRVYSFNFFYDVEDIKKRKFFMFFFPENEKGFIEKYGLKNLRLRFYEDRYSDKLKFEVKPRLHKIDDKNYFYVVEIDPNDVSSGTNLEYMGCYFARLYVGEEILGSFGETFKNVSKGRFDNLLPNLGNNFINFGKNLKNGFVDEKDYLGSATIVFDKNDFNFSNLKSHIDRIEEFVKKTRSIIKSLRDNQETEKQNKNKLKPRDVYFNSNELRNDYTFRTEQIEESGNPKTLRTYVETSNLNFLPYDENLKVMFYCDEKCEGKPEDTFDVKISKDGYFFDYDIGESDLAIGTKYYMLIKDSEDNPLLKGSFEPCFSTKDSVKPYLFAKLSLFKSEISSQNNKSDDEGDDESCEYENENYCCNLEKNDFENLVLPNSLNYKEHVVNSYLNNKTKCLRVNP